MRKKNMVVYNLEEFNSNKKADIEKHDKEKIIEMVTAVLGVKTLKKEEIVKTARMGEKITNRSRPVLVEFVEETKKESDLQKAAQSQRL